MTTITTATERADDIWLRQFQTAAYEAGKEAVATRHEAPHLAEMLGLDVDSPEALTAAVLNAIRPLVVAALATVLRGTENITAAERYAEGMAITAFARGNREKEREWLDMLALIERIPNQPAHARQDVPAMSAALRAVLDLHAPEITEGVDLGEPWCVACGDASPCPTELAITTHLDGRGVHEVIGAALLSGRTEAEVKAEGLREAADVFDLHGTPLETVRLRARALQIERGEG